MIFRFREFPVYKDARIFCQELKKFSSEKLPPEEKFALRDQLWRALDSIILNIAEGSHKYSDLEFSNYLNHSLTSLSEVVAVLDISLDNKYISKEENEYWIQKAELLYRQLSAFSSKVRNDAKRR